MAFASVKQILLDAQEKNYGVVAFDCFNYESIAWAVEAAELENVPVIIMQYPATKKIIPFTAFSAITKAVADRVKVPVGLHLDHSYDLDEIKEALEAGFPSVMFDGSKLSFEDNIKYCKQVAEMAKGYGASVEAELGKVGTAGNLEDFADSSKYTKPEEAKEFVERTGVDYLAVAIGSAHGFYVATPKLDLLRLRELDKAVNVPLVLHGGTGIPDDQLLEAGHLGINKLNVGTELDAFFFQYTAELTNNAKDKHYGSYTVAMQERIVDYYRKKLHVIGA